MGRLGRAYPDSVSRVNPPNTTMPKTLAALPRSQYATVLDVVLGKLLDLLSLAAAASATMVRGASDWPKVALFRRGCVDFHLTECAMEDRGVEHREAERAGEIGKLRHGRYTNSRLESRGAAVRNCGNAWKIEAMAAPRRGVVGKKAHKWPMVLSSTFRWHDRPARSQWRQASDPASRPLAGGSGDPLVSHLSKLTASRITRPGLKQT